ncbi:MAG: Holliday junction resolvase RuvX [Acidobacteria bacterium]|nr:MAG: Holliday junction resolvase RuvX [Acidobacteriota bacterium]
MNYPITISRVQQKESSNSQGFTDLPAGRIVAIDPGTKRIGVAVSDPDRILASPLPIVERTSWKKLLLQIRDTLAEYDAKALVVGLPYNFDGTESEMTAEARGMARKLELSVDVPVYLQDERATTYEARGRLWKAGLEGKGMQRVLDSEAARIILTDFLDRIGSFLE